MKKVVLVGDKNARRLSRFGCHRVTGAALEIRVWKHVKNLCYPITPFRV
jgi:hypothetical protein